MMRAPPLPLSRRMVDVIDHGMLVLLAARRASVAAIGRRKRALDLPLRDPIRERGVHAQARRRAQQLHIPDDSASALVDVLIADACRQQRTTTFSLRTISMSQVDTATESTWMGWLPPPSRWRPLVEHLPTSLQHRALQLALGNGLAPLLAHGVFDPVRGRRIGVHVEDLGLRWVCALERGQLRVLEGEAAEATVAGTATDLLLLASRLEDADTLFFQRRLRLTGDVELGLTLRNLLDRLPWESLPLGTRIVLQRGAGFAERARAAYRARKRQR